MKTITTRKSQRNLKGKRVYTTFKDVSLTDASQLQQTDVNYIYAKYIKTGDDSLLKQRQGSYADLTQLPDLGEALSTIQIANNSFMSIPAKLRARFNNDPQEFIQFLQDPENDAEAIKLGFKVEKPQITNLDNSPSTANPPKAHPSKKSKPTQQTLPTDED